MTDVILIVLGIVCVVGVIWIVRRALFVPVEDDFSRIGKDHPLYVACMLHRDSETLHAEGDVQGSSLPLDVLSGCVGVFPVFTSRKKALEHAETVIKISPEKDEED